MSWLHESYIGEDLYDNVTDVTFFDSMFVVYNCPQHFNPEVFDWRNHSDLVAIYLPDKFDSEKFNWADFSHYVTSLPQYFDPEKFNWDRFSRYVIRECPEHFDYERFNWQDEDATVHYFNYVGLSAEDQVEILFHEVKTFARELSDRLDNTTHPMAISELSYLRNCILISISRLNKVK